MLTSGQFSNNQAGQLKVLVVLTSTDVGDKQEPITPLRTDEYSTPAKDGKKRKVKQEDSSPAPGLKKRIKQERQINQGNGTKNREQVKQEKAVPASTYLNLAYEDRNDILGNIVVKGDVVDLSESEDAVTDLMLDSVSDGEGDERDADQEDEVDCSSETSLFKEFVSPRSAVIPDSIEGVQTQQYADGAVEGLPPAQSTRFRGTKIPMTFASRPRKRKD
ncbi:hypothetical protein FOPG_20187 [Fusarium oxysporum f. sp. conglutinans race 2 54008]|uniref:Uncharacterized protein n=1 Tax=Fusarium oxysporum f. sp. conglutinans race 2 54008 TaxID=1089457 RepID=X0GUE4_FUSOX|nr:hypothetical protein FOPG_20187 [Fusarium oxysporum f. sp. conglutinans race 2 54008]